MSRKLLFFSSLLTVFSCFRNESLRRSGAEREEYLLRVQEHLLEFVHSTSLNIISWTLAGLGFDEECRLLFDEYERFVVVLDDKGAREHLGKLNQDVYGNELFLRCRDFSHKLQRTLKHVCFELESPLKDFMLEFGVF